MSREGSPSTNVQVMTTASTRMAPAATSRRTWVMSQTPIAEMTEWPCLGAPRECLLNFGYFTGTNLATSSRICLTSHYFRAFDGRAVATNNPCGIFVPERGGWANLRAPFWNRAAGEVLHPVPVPALGQGGMERHWHMLVSCARLGTHFRQLRSGRSNSASRQTRTRIRLMSGEW